MTEGVRSDAATVRDECLRCGGPRHHLGRRDFRTGGGSGAATFFFQGLVEFGEKKVPLEVFVCARCRDVTFRYPDPDL